MWSKIILYLAVTACFAQDFQNYLTRPALSSRCESLVEQRNLKVKSLQRLNGLLNRNLKIERQARKNQNRLMGLLKINRKRIENHIDLYKLKIKNMEENIVRKGCPGIVL